MQVDITKLEGSHYSGCGCCSSASPLQTEFFYTVKIKARPTAQASLFDYCETHYKQLIKALVEGL